MNGAYRVKAVPRDVALRERDISLGTAVGDSLVEVWAETYQSVMRYLELTKARITLFVVMSTAVGYFSTGCFTASWALFHTLLGTWLMAGGTATLNQWYERDADAKMNRTMARPIPSGRVGAGRALWFGVALSGAGFVDLSLGADYLAGLLGMFTLVSYLFVYTPLKQRSPHSTTIGAIPGAVPPLIGVAAATGTLDMQAWILYGILFLWQFPHFYAIAWMYRGDYARAGIRMLPVVEPDGNSTSRRVVVFSSALILVSLMPRSFCGQGNLYLTGAIALGALFLFAGIRAALYRTHAAARQLLIASVVYLPLLYGCLIVDRLSLCFRW